MKNPYPLHWIQALQSGFKRQNQLWEKVSADSYQQQIREIQSNHFSQLLEQGFSTVRNVGGIINNTDLFLEVISSNKKREQAPLSDKKFPVIMDSDSFSPTCKIHFHNGDLVEGKNINSGLMWGTWKDLGKSFPCSKWIVDQLLKNKCNSFNCLANALPANGFLLFVPEECKKTHFIHLHFSFDNTSKKTSFWNLRNFIFMEKHAHVTLMETISSSSSHVVNSVTDIKISPYSSLKRLQINRGQMKSTHFNHTICEMELESVLYNLIINLDMGFSKDEIEVDHLGEKAKSVLSNLQIIKNKEYREQRYSVNHLKKGGYSRHFSRGVLNDLSKNLFYGRIHVDSKAIHTNCGQSVKNLLLSPNAFSSMQPELQIDCADVKAQHGATAGHLHEDDVFYLQSRGLDKKSAFELLLFTYIQDVLETFPSPDLMKQLKKYIQKNKRILLNL